MPETTTAAGPSPARVGRRRSLALFAAAIAAIGTVGLLGPAATLAETPSLAAPFVLTDHHGQRVSDRQFRGRHVLVFFGYTYCPDICPIALTNITETLDQLGAAAERVTPLFVTLDPERDTPAQLAGYVSHFHPAIVGLTGSVDAITEMAAAYQVTYYKVPDGDDYFINHSGGVYVVDPEGIYQGFFDFDEPPEAVANTLREMIDGRG